MKIRIRAVALCATTLFAAQSYAEGWVLGPAFKPGWKPEFTVAALGGYLGPKSNLSDNDTYAGAEISLNCPWFQPPSGTIRQQFWLGRYKDNGVELRSFEVNPRYFVDLGSGLSVGAGPGFGYIQADTPYRDSVGMGSLQLGGDLSYRSGSLFLGVGGRYQFTQDKDIGLGEKGADNWLVSAKIGVNF